MIGPAPDRMGGAFGNVLLVLASLSLLAAVIYPRFADRAFEARVDAVAADIDRLRGAAVTARGQSGTWPPSGSVGVPAPELTTPRGTTTDSDGGPRLAWRRLEAVEVPEPPAGITGSVPEAAAEAAQEGLIPEPSYFHRGAISVRAADEALLGALVRRYPGSFVHEGVWTLLLPRVPAPAGP